MPLREVGPKTGVRQTAVADLCLLEGFHEPVLCVLQEAPMRTWSGGLSFHNHTYRKKKKKKFEDSNTLSIVLFESSCHCICHTIGKY